jgi:molybdopterin synthase sulfur carrier subunit
MEIKLSLLGVLKDRTPEGGLLELPEGASIQDAIAVLELPKSIHLASINGEFKRELDMTLNDGDELIILPPVAGG